MAPPHRGVSAGSGRGLGLHATARRGPGAAWRDGRRLGTARLRRRNRAIRASTVHRLQSVRAQDLTELAEDIASFEDTQRRLHPVRPAGVRPSGHERASSSAGSVRHPAELWVQFHEVALGWDWRSQTAASVDRARSALDGSGVRQAGRPDLRLGRGLATAARRSRGLERVVADPEQRPDERLRSWPSRGRGRSSDPGPGSATSEPTGQESCSDLAPAAARARRSQTRVFAFSSSVGERRDSVRIWASVSESGSSRTFPRHSVSAHLAACDVLRAALSGRDQRPADERDGRAGPRGTGGDHRGSSDRLGVAGLRGRRAGSGGRRRCDGRARPRPARRAGTEQDRWASEAQSSTASGSLSNERWRRWALVRC